MRFGTCFCLILSLNCFAAKTKKALIVSTKAASACNTALGADAPIPVNYIPLDELPQSTSLSTRQAKFIELTPHFFINPGPLDMFQPSPSSQLKPAANGRIDGLTYVRNAAGEDILVATSEHEVSLSFIDSSGKVIGRLANFQEKDGAGWSPDIEVVSPNKRYIVTAGGMSHLTLIDTHTMRIVQKLPLHKSFNNEFPFKTFFSPDSETIFVLSDLGRLEVWSKSANRFKLKQSNFLLRKKGLEAFSLPPIASAVLQDDTLWIGSHEGDLSEFSVSAFQEGQVLSKQVHQFVARADLIVSNIAFDPNNKSLWVSLEHMKSRSDQAAEVTLVKIDPATGKFLLKIDGAHIGSAAQNLFVTENSLVSISTDPESSVASWSKDTGELLSRYTLRRASNRHYLESTSGPYDPIHSAIFDPSTQTVVVGYDGGKIAIIDSRTGQFKGAFSIPSGDIRALSFSPDSNTLAVGAHRGYTGIFDTKGINETPLSALEE